MPTHCNIYFFYDINDLKYSWERDWLKNDLFADTEDVTYSWKHINSIDDVADAAADAKIIFIINKQTLHKIDSFKRDFMLIHLSDEYLNDYLCMYKSPYCKHVFRNYLLENDDDDTPRDNVTYIPLGYKQGMFATTSAEECKLNTDRKYTWSFVGAANKSNRMNVLKNLYARVDNCFNHIISGWNSANSINADKYSIILKDTWIVPCLRGNINVDTFRLIEALECGCIPIVVKKNRHFRHNKEEYYTHLFDEEHPIPTINNDSELVPCVLNILENKEDIRKTIMTWYAAYKAKLIEKIKNIIAPPELELIIGEE